MAILHVRNVPEKLYRRIQELAEEEQRSMTGEVIALLDAAVERREARKRTAGMLSRIRRRSATVKLPPGWGDSVELVREDRKR